MGGNHCCDFIGGCRWEIPRYRVLHGTGGISIFYRPLIISRLGKQAIEDASYIGISTADTIHNLNVPVGLFRIELVLLGTKADATLGRDIILFIEEVGESMHNIDRQFNILAMNGVLKRCKGVVLGEFTGCGSEFTYESVEQMLRQQLVKYNIPLLCGFPGGHGDINLPVVMGAPVTIDVRSDGATLRFDIDGRQQMVVTSEIQIDTTQVGE